MKTKDIEIQTTTMCSPNYSPRNRKVAGKKKHHISVKNNRIHTYKLVDGKHVPCNEGRCKVIKDVFYRALGRDYRYSSESVCIHPRGILPDTLREFIGSAYAVKLEREKIHRQSEHHLYDHLDVCVREAEYWKRNPNSRYGTPEHPMCNGRTLDLRVHWILQHKLKKFSNPDSEFDSLFYVNTYGRGDYRLPMKAKPAHVYLRVIDWLECDKWPTRTAKRYIGNQWVEHTEAIPLNEYSAIWLEADTLGESDYIYFAESGRPMTLAKLYRDGTIEYLPRVRM